METSDANLEAMMAAPNFDPEQLGARFWYEQYLRQRAETTALRTQLTQLQAEVEQLKETLRKLSERDSGNSSQPPSSDGYKRKSKAIVPRQRNKSWGRAFGRSQLALLLAVTNYVPINTGTRNIALVRIHSLAHRHDNIHTDS